MMGEKSARRFSRTAVSASCLVATLGVVSTAGTAHADVVLRVNYPMSGTTFIKSTNSTMALGPGSLEAALDETGAMTGAAKLPPATGEFKLAGVIPVEVKTEFIETTPTTGTVDLSTGEVRSTSKFTLRITSLKVAGIPTIVGNGCQTESPLVISVVSDADFNVLTGGNLNGTYTIPNFKNCVLSTALINLVVPGSGNTITLTLGAATVPAGDPAKVFHASALR